MSENTENEREREGGGRQWIKTDISCVRKCIFKSKYAVNQKNWMKNALFLYLKKKPQILQQRCTETEGIYSRGYDILHKNSHILIYFFMRTLSVFKISLKKVKKPNTNTLIW